MNCLTRLLGVLAFVAALPVYAQTPLFELPPVTIQEPEPQAGQPTPWRVAETVAVDISPDTHGAWTLQNDGSWLWQLRVRSADATQLSLGFTRFDLPAGAALQVGEQLLLEAWQPAGSAPLELQLNSVFRGFR